MPAFEAVVIGGGTGGAYMAQRLAQSGMRTAIVERKRFGGTCVNVGCTPTKTLVASAYAAHIARRAGDYGVAIGGPVSVDMKRVKARKDAIVARQRVGLEEWLRETKNCTIYEGHAPLHVAARGPRRRRGADGRADLHRCRRTRCDAAAAGAGPGRLSDQFDDPGDRLPAAASGGRRRQLYRPRIRADVPALRQRGDGHRDGAAFDRARGRGRLGRHSRDPAERRRCRCGWMPNASRSTGRATGSRRISTARTARPTSRARHLLLADRPSAQHG